MLVGLVCLLTGCAASTKYVKPTLPGMPSKVEAGCLSPLLIPEKELSQLDVEKYWGVDRNSLRTCKKLDKNKAEWYRELRREFNARP